MTIAVDWDVKQQNKQTKPCAQLTGLTQARHFILCQVLIQPKKNLSRHDRKIVDMDIKNQNKQNQAEGANDELLERVLDTFGQEMGD